jgi:hypothetical protein
MEFRLRFLFVLFTPPDTLFGFGEDTGFAVFAVEAESFELHFLVLVDVRPGFGAGFCQEAINTALLQRTFANLKLFALPYGPIKISRIDTGVSMLTSHAKATVFRFSRNRTYLLPRLYG